MHSTLQLNVPDSLKQWFTEDCVTSVVISDLWDDVGFTLSKTYQRDFTHTFWKKKKKSSKSRVSKHDIAPESFKSSLRNPVSSNKFDKANT